MEILASPGVPDIKKVELYKKYCPLIPQQYRDITCPHPGEDVLLRIKTERNKKAQQRQKAKKEKKEVVSQRIWRRIMRKYKKMSKKL